MKYEKPEFVKFYEAHPGTPRCCFLCQYFNNPMCSKYNMQVPQNFAESLDQCADWIDEEGIPF